MEKKVIAWKTKGMNRDLSVSAFSPEFSFENVNLRLSTNEGNTLMSWVNEKGTRKLTIQAENNDFQLSGIPVGTAVLNHQLVIFTTEYSGEVERTNEKDYIYVLVFSDKEEGILEGKVYYSGNLSFNPLHPLETLVSYEAEHIQKVYWTDGENQPRLINIAKTDTSNYTDTSFDFLPTLQEGAGFSFEVSQQAGLGGTFLPGVIQYCMTYYNRYGQQSNIVAVSPLYYLSKTDRGASPTETVNSTFTITITYPDGGLPKFDFIRLYSIHRSSLDDGGTVKLLDDVDISKATEHTINSTTTYTYTYTDNGSSGTSMDPSELLYVGGKEIKALTMVDKDNTLFLGNLTVEEGSVKGIHEKLPNEVSVKFYYDDYDPNPSDNNSVEPAPSAPTSGMKDLDIGEPDGFYSYQSTLQKSHPEITTFKGGETYRFGFQLQKHTGEWTEPVWIQDATNYYYPRSFLYGYNNSIDSNTVKLVFAQATIPFKKTSNNESTTIIDTSKYKSIRPVIVYPSIEDRSVLCQGVLNPTVFNAVDRESHSPDVQSSWFFRPYMINKLDTSIEVTADTTVDENVYNNWDVSTLVEEDKVLYPFVVVGSIAKSKVDAILNRGWLQFNVAVWMSLSGVYYIRPVKATFEGAVCIEPGTAPNNFDSYAFFFKSYPRFNTVYWPGNGTDPQAYGSIDDLDDIYYKVFSTSQNIYLSSKMHSTPGKNLFYYKKASQSDTDPIKYKFSLKKLNAVNTKYYHLVFTSLGSAISGFFDGADLPYTHYESLDSSGEYRAEIQNASNMYDSVYGNALFDKPANSQFFIDQSVVTLHSPDLEFDTAVASAGKEGWKLRMVGVVPITANISSHSITHGAMDEAGKTNGNPTDVHKYGAGELNLNVLHSDISSVAGNRLVSSYLWNDVAVVRENNVLKTSNKLWDFMIYPWQRTGSLNNDDASEDKAVSQLIKKKEANLLYSRMTEYRIIDHEGEPYRSIPGGGIGHNYPGLPHGKVYDSFDLSGMEICLTENEQVMNYRLPKQSDHSSQLNYYANIDKLLYNKDGFTSKSTYSPSSDQTNIDFAKKIYSPVSMKYKSTTHAVLALAEGKNPSGPSSVSEEERIWILPKAKIGNVKWGEPEVPGESPDTFWGDTEMTFHQSEVNLASFFRTTSAPYYNKHNVLWLGELYREVPDESRFGGTSDMALRNNTWYVGGKAVPITGSDTEATLQWTEGDTFVQRYDCLKTYAFTPEDKNQIVEILSFLCETHVNIDGRYDRNRGQSDNTNMNPQIFNLLNPVYSQTDNFFSYKITASDEKESFIYPNQIYFTKTKTAGADVDAYTNITLSSLLDLDGDKGSITSLNRVRDSLVAFQDTGIAQILYNENTQISTTEGVPVEIANSGKVQGKRYLHNTIGCTNKWSIASSQAGLYFADSHNRGLYLLDNQLSLTDISSTKGFNSWAKQRITSDIWNPGSTNLVSYYDKQNQEVLFLENGKALAFSEKLGTFTSFYDYGTAPYFCNLESTGVWIGKSQSEGTNPYSLWQHQAGAYNTFFEKQYPYSMTLVGNADPLLDKTFTNLEFRACVEGDGEEENNQFKFLLPFDSLETWDEYQHGKTELKDRQSRNAFLHGGSESALLRKFRIWRCDVPRDNVDIVTVEPVKPVLPENPTPKQEAQYEADMVRYEADMVKYGQYLEDVKRGISRFRKRPLDRMRNPWIYLKLQKEVVEEEGVPKIMPKIELHDLLMYYYI